MVIIDYLGNCSDRGIANLALKIEEKGRRCSYKEAIKAVKIWNSEFYYSLALDFYNPWSKDTYLMGNKLCITHSAIEYVFLIEN